MEKRLVLKLLVLLGVSAILAGGTVFSGAPAGAGESAGLAHRGILPPRNPADSLWPAPSFMASCGQGDDGAQCNGVALTAIGHARQALESWAPCPSRWSATRS